MPPLSLAGSSFCALLPYRTAAGTSVGSLGKSLISRAFYHPFAEALQRFINHPNLTTWGAINPAEFLMDNGEFTFVSAESTSVWRSSNGKLTTSVLHGLGSFTGALLLYDVLVWLDGEETLRLDVLCHGKQPGLVKGWKVLDKLGDLAGVLGKFCMESSGVTEVPGVEDFEDPVLRLAQEHDGAKVVVKNLIYIALTIHIMAEASAHATIRSGFTHVPERFFEAFLTKSGRNLDGDLPRAFKQLRTVTRKIITLRYALLSAVAISPLVALVTYDICRNTPCPEELILNCKRLGNQRPLTLIQLERALWLEILAIAEGRKTAHSALRHLQETWEGCDWATFLGDSRFYFNTGPEAEFSDQSLVGASLVGAIPSSWPLPPRLRPGIYANSGSSPSHVDSSPLQVKTVLSIGLPQANSADDLSQKTHDRVGSCETESNEGERILAMGFDLLKIPSSSADELCLPRSASGSSLPVLVAEPSGTSNDVGTPSVPRRSLAVEKTAPSDRCLTSITVGHTNSAESATLADAKPHAQRLSIPSNRDHLPAPTASTPSTSQCDNVPPTSAPVLSNPPTGAIRRNSNSPSANVLPLAAASDRVLSMLAESPTPLSAFETPQIRSATPTTEPPFSFRSGTGNETPVYHSQSRGGAFSDPLALSLIHQTGVPSPPKSPSPLGAAQGRNGSSSLQMRILPSSTVGTLIHIPAVGAEGCLNIARRSPPSQTAQTDVNMESERTRPHIPTSPYGETSGAGTASDVADLNTFNEMVQRTSGDVELVTAMIDDKTYPALRIGEFTHRYSTLERHRHRIYDSDGSLYMYNPAVYTREDTVAWKRILLEVVKEYASSSNPTIRLPLTHANSAASCLVMYSRELFSTFKSETVLWIMGEVENHIIIIGDGKPSSKFNADGLKSLKSAPNPLRIEDQSLGLLGNDRNSRMRTGSSLDLLRASTASPRRTKALKTLDCPNSLGDVSMRSFTSDLVAMRRTSSDLGCSATLPTDAIRFGRAATSGAHSYWKIESHGEGAFFSYACGEELWVIAKPVNDRVLGSIWCWAPPTFDIRNLDPHYWRLELAYMKEGDELILLPSTPYAVITKEDSIVHGGHFLATSTLGRTILGFVHTFFRGALIAQTDRTSIHYRLGSIVAFIHKTIALGDRTPEDSGHVPVIDSPLSLENILLFACGIELLNATSMSSYLPTKDSHLTSWLRSRGETEHDGLVAHDISALGMQTRHLNALSRGRMRDVLRVIFQGLHIKDVRRQPQDPMTFLFLPMLAWFITALRRYYDLAFSRDVVAGDAYRVPNRKLFNRQLDWIVSRYPELESHIDKLQDVDVDNLVCRLPAYSMTHQSTRLPDGLFSAESLLDLGMHQGDRMYIAATTASRLAPSTSTQPRPGSKRTVSGSAGRSSKRSKLQ